MTDSGAAGFIFSPQLLVRPDVSQNGGVGSLKELSLHRNTKKNEQKPSESTLSELWEAVKDL